GHQQPAPQGPRPARYHHLPEVSSIRRMPPGPSGDGAAGGHPGEGLPRARRIQKRPDFVRIQDSPVRVTTRHLLILLARAAGAPLLPEQPSTPRRPSRLGGVASRKVGPAVTRNRAKRLVRETFRRSGDTFPAGLDVVIIVRPSPRWGPRPPHRRLHPSSVSR